ncbi:MAG TPA: HNH endonuclease signature motif containing protein [Allosphingosinicella sp.]|jgi:5-methylcytosine-specific restriction protein A
MADIPPAAVHAAYEAAKRVYRGEIDEASAREDLAARGVISSASAYSYIRNLSPMLAGERYHFTINAYATGYYLKNILADFGPGAAHLALMSVRSHLAAYRKGKGRSGHLKDIEAICDSFEGSLDTLATEQGKFERAVEKSRKLSRVQRAAKLAEAPRKPKRIIVQTLAYKRNPHVVAAVLERAAGTCERCGCAAPFLRASDGEPYLEVHHAVRLADGGDDTVDNALAVCPNCHRETHYGPMPPQSER